MPTDPEQRVPGVKSVDTTVEGATGKIPVRIATPEGAGPFPVVVYFHGGRETAGGNLAGAAAVAAREAGLQA